MNVFTWNFIFLFDTLLKSLVQSIKKLENWETNFALFLEILSELKISCSSRDLIIFIQINLQYQKVYKIYKLFLVDNSIFREFLFPLKHLICFVNMNF